MQLFRVLAPALVLGLVIAQPARALTLLRDPDIENALRQLAAPVLKAAGLSPTRTNILVIDDRRLNAFVVDRDNIFIHSGLLLKMDSPEMLQAVIAHEAAHIANGHLVRRPVAMRNARTAAGIGVALAAAAGVAGGNAQAAGALALGASSTAQRLFFAHTRAEESSADASSVRYLVRAGVDPQGAVAVMDIFRGQEALSVGRQDPYARSHPLSADRYRVIKRLADANAGKASGNRSADYWFARAKGKLSAFQRAPKWTLTRAGESGFRDVALMREAIAHHRQSQMGRALRALDQAIALRPDDPYFYELRGQILMENRHFGQAAASYGRAVNAAPRDALILGSYGRALLAQGQYDKALRVLSQARDRDGRDSRVMRDLGVAYAKTGNRGMASLVTAERYALQGRLGDATVHATRASDMLPRGSGGWHRAQDVLSAAKSVSR
ncbi:M48 family metalloprotease [Roseovarius sp. SCSIO 43702]|uniref:M48 family metalloprotease n=1 Tax=Roseovarius sp. SCSIO 43702 TaxID=2823043 RepID=UPI001C72CC4B|nr:M48 family metalloprotease [Roseovarius sp. SCSIO 43702]QYX55328.1 M48 family metalloprotease [Roseovarius sp. SCSIO 43702]